MFTQKFQSQDYNKFAFNDYILYTKVHDKIIIKAFFPKKVYNVFPYSIIWSGHMFTSICAGLYLKINFELDLKWNKRKL